MVTSQPCERNAWASPNPIPLVLPVITIHLMPHLRLAFFACAYEQRKRFCVAFLG